MKSNVKRRGERERGREGEREREREGERRHEDTMRKKSENENENEKLICTLSYESCFFFLKTMSPSLYLPRTEVRRSLIGARRFVPVWACWGLEVQGP